MKIVFILIVLILTLTSCQNNKVIRKTIEINSKQIDIKFKNFSNINIDEKCLIDKTSKLLEAINNNKISIYKSIFFINHNHFKRLSSLSNIEINIKKENKYILLPINKKQFFLSNKAFDKANKETFMMYELLTTINFNNCIKENNGI